MLRLMRYLTPYIMWVILLVVLVFLQVQCDLKMPEYMAAIINEGVMMRDTGVILSQGLRMILLSFVSIASTIAVGYIAARVGSGMSERIRGDVFAKVESFSLAEFDKFSTASLITRSTNDVQQVQMVIIMILRMFISAPMTGIIAVQKASAVGSGMTWIMAVAVIAVTLMVVVLFFLALPRFKLIQKKTDRLNLVTRESLTGIRVIRAFNTQAHEEKRFEEASSDLVKTQLFVNRLMSLMFPYMMVIMNLTTVSIVWLGSHMVGEGTILIGNMMEFIQYTMQVIMSFLMLTMAFIMVPRASVSGDRITEVLDTKPSITEPENPKPAQKFLRGYVEFDHVTFYYPGAEEPVLRDISFTAKPGQTTAFIGSTGSGKSTLINLIPRLYDVTEGSVRVAGTDVREQPMEELCAQIGYVPQKGVLFSGTVASNISFGAPDASLAQMREAAETSQAAEFIDDLQDKYLAPIAQGGTNVSGGQRQRLSIARAVVRKPSIYIFDDSFSALDFRTDAALRAALAESTKDASVLIVAQRVSTIMYADQIVVLEQGQMAGVGTHRELLNTCEVYREIAQSQLSEEELA